MERLDEYISWSGSGRKEVQVGQQGVGRAFLAGQNPGGVSVLVRWEMKDGGGLLGVE